MPLDSVLMAQDGHGDNFYKRVLVMPAFFNRTELVIHTHKSKLEKK